MAIQTADCLTAAALANVLRESGFQAAVRPNRAYEVEVRTGGNAAHYAVLNGKLHYTWASEGFDPEYLDSQVEGAFALI